MEWFIKSTL